MRRIRWRLLASFTILTVLLAFMPALVTGVVLRRYALDDLENDLAQRGRGLAVTLAAGGTDRITDARPGTAEGQRLEDLIRRAGAAAEERITLVDEAGRVLADSEHDPSTMENHRGRPEVAAALAGRTGRSRRVSETLGSTFLYVAVPLDAASPGSGAVRLAVPTSRVESLLYATWWIPLLVGLVALLPVLLLTLLVARSITTPIERLETMASSVAEGDLSYRVGALRRDELGQLGRALNTMAESLERQVKDLSRARDETEAIVSSMQDGLIVLDPSGRVVRANTAAATMLGCERTMEGELLLHVARSFAASPVIREAASGPTGGEVEGTHGRIFAVRTVSLDAVGDPQVLVLFRDETARRRVERMRRDFVANVSHELKTPLAHLMLLASTLSHAVEEDPERAREFAVRVSEQVKALSLLVDDLLTLSRLEEQEGVGQPSMREVDLTALAREVCRSFIGLSISEGKSIEVDAEPGVSIHGDRLLLETLLRNLVDNALRYNHLGGHVWVRVRGSEPVAVGDVPQEDTGAVVLSVGDDGPGIPTQHRDRIFERFYRVDEARSSSGTGLGLSIVRHIAEGHGATLTLTSSVGQGSTFTLRFPSPEPKG